VTPPVCIPAYCAASIAGAKPLQTGFEAFKMAIVAFTIPYIFVFNRALLLKGGVVETLSLLMVLLMAVVFLSAAVTGFFFKHIGLFLRAVMLAAAFGGVVLCTQRELVAQPLTFGVSVAIVLAFLFYVYLWKPRQSQAA
jgi:TRAP-type uncharacterized transport system fused permease subunit